MALWTDLITPQELTGYARESLAALERRKGTLARYLPNQDKLGTTVRFVRGEHGLVEEATFRAYDAEPEVGATLGGQRVTLELPAMTRTLPVSEYDQLKALGSSDDVMLKQILKTTDAVVASIADGVERMRGIVLATGKATINQANFQVEDDFGRSTELTVAASTKWSDPAAKILDDLQAWAEKYDELNGVAPGALVVSRQVANAVLRAAEFRTVMADGATRPASLAAGNEILVDHGLPPMEIFRRRTKSGPVIPTATALFLPEPGDAAGFSELGGTFWGQTLTATHKAWDIPDAEQPGLVVGTYLGEKPPLIAEVIGDAIVLPVLANANLTMAMGVL